MIQFSYPRFRNVLRHEWAENRRMYLVTFLVLLILLAAIFCLMNLLPDVSFGNPIKKVWIAIIYPFAACYVLSLTYAHLGRKEHRISNFMLPASNFEKALARHLVTILGFHVVFLLSYICAEFVSTIFLIIVNIKAVIAHLDQVPTLLYRHSTLRSFGNFFAYYSAETYMYLSCHVVACSMFIFGSAIFRRFAFLKTILIIWFVNPIYLFAIYSYFCGSYYKEPVQATIFCLLMLALAAFITYAAYRRYCRLQVI